MDKTNGLGKEYLEHKTFKQFTEFASFYDSLSYTAMGFVSQGTKSIVNLGTYVFTSIKDTIEYWRNGTETTAKPLSESSQEYKIVKESAKQLGLNFEEDWWKGWWSDR